LFRLGAWKLRSKTKGGEKEDAYYVKKERMWFIYC